MKKGFLIILLFIPAIAVMAQSGGLVMTSKVLVWTDSLQYTANDSDAVKDSVWIIPVNFRCDFFRIYLDGNANDPVDSISLELGAIVYNDDGDKIDTTWGSAISVKDSAWNTLQTMVNKSTSKDYSTYFMPPVELMRLSLLNYADALPERTVRVTLHGTK